MNLSNTFHQSVHQIFEDVVKRYPDQIALISQDKTFTYLQLNEKSNQLANYLKSRLSIQPADIVGILSEPDEWIIISMLAILKCRAAYMPLSPRFPQKRIDFMMDIADTKTILCSKSWMAKLPDSYNRISFENMETEIGKYPSHNLDSITSLGDLAYIMFTSGTTGNPNGVEIPNRGIIRLVCNANYFPYNQPHTFLQLSTVSFDASTFEIWGALLNGNKLVLYPDLTIDFHKLESIISNHSISCLFLTTSLFNLIVEDHPGCLEKISYVLTGGEMASVRQVQLLQRLLPNLKILNVYGPTECTTFASCYPVPSLAGLAPDSIPIGKAIDKTQLFILNDDLTPAETGEIGELFIGGEGLALGYRKQEDLTKEKFIYHSFSANQNIRLYRTGDLCRFNHSGDIEFIGRKDNQCKIRGFRVETGEIESVIKKQHEIRDCLVIINSQKDHLELIAYITGYAKSKQPPGTLCKTIDEIKLKAEIQQWLPDYMIPSRFIELNQFPLNDNLKIDRSRLPDPINFKAHKEGYQIGSQRDMELKNIWIEIFNQPNIGLSDDFFELGGNSLHCTRMIYKINKTYQVEIPLKEFIKYPTIKYLSVLIDLFPKEQSVELTLNHFHSELPVPLSPTQQTLWVFNELNKGSHAYNVALKVDLTGELNSEFLEIALNEVINQQEALRTSIITVNGQPMQLINKFDKVPLDIIDVSGLTESELDELLLKNAMIPFDLEEHNLIKWKLFKTNKLQHTLFYNVHHIFFDGWSIGVFNRAVSDSYNALIQKVSLAPIEKTLVYKDYTFWQWKLANSDFYSKHIAFWKQKVGNNPEPSELLTDFERPVIQTYNGKIHEITIEYEFLEQIKTFAKEHRLTLFTFLISCFNALLYRYIHKKQIIIGSHNHNRLTSEIQDMIGYITNNLLFSTDLSDDISFCDLLHQVKSNFDEAIEFQGVPFDLLIRNFIKHRDFGKSPLFQILFVLQNANGNGLQLDGLAATQKLLDTNSSKFDLSVFCEEVTQGLHIKIEYNTDLYASVTMERFLLNYLTITRNIIKNPASKISDLSFIHPDELEELRSEWNRPEQPFAHDKTIHALFEEQAERTPGKTAIIFQKTEYSYQEINYKANLLANHLIATYSCHSDILIGVMMERSEKLLIALLAILKAGSAYIPIDLNFPENRIIQMVEDSKIQIIVCDTQTEKSLIKMRMDLDLVNVVNFVNGNFPTQNPVIKNSPTDLAYCIYTSGSTGKPKAVMIEHRSVVNLIEGVTNQLKLNRFQKILCLTTFNFDIFVVESFLPLINGMTIVLADENDNLEPDLVAELIEKNKIEIIQATPSRMNWLLMSENAGISLQKVKVIMLGGEVLEPNLFQTIKGYSPAKIFNMYGPTETTVWSTYKELFDNKITIGNPIQNNKIFVLDKNKKLCPIGVPGELAIGGLSLARGYLNNAEITKEKFIHNPFLAGERLYLTGDLVRRLWNHDLEYLGRLDSQIKLRGHRIELHEIEKNIKQIEVVRECLVSTQIVNSERELVAYLTLKSYTPNGYTNRVENESREADIEISKQPQSETTHHISTNVLNNRLFQNELNDIKNALKSKLPKYMIPVHFMILDIFPMNNNGKVDKLRLPVPALFSDITIDSSEKPNSTTEEELLQIWRKVLVNDQISVSDNFFEIGGYSLLAIKLIYEINCIFKTKLTPKELFIYPTIVALARRIVEPLSEPGSTEGIFRIREGDGENIFLAPGLDGNPYLFADLKNNYKGRNTLYSFEYPKSKDKQQKASSMQELTRYFIDQIHQIQPVGRYNFAGFCFGGRLIFEIAIQLQKSGKEVGLMAIIDTMAYKKNWTRHYRINMIIHELLIFKLLTNDYKLIYLKNRFKYFLTEKIPRLKNKYLKRNATSVALSPEEFLRLEWHRYVLDLWKNYCPEIKFKGEILLYKEENHLYPIKEELHYINLVYPDLYWKNYIDGQIKYVILDCEHLEFFRPKNVHKILDPMVEYFL